MESANRTRIGIVTADPLRALGLETILREDPSIDAASCDLHAAAGDESLAVLLLDDRCEGEDVVRTVTRLSRERPGLKLVVLGEAPDFEYIRAVMHAGAHGYLLQTTSEDEIRKAVQAVVKGEVWAPPKSLARLVGTGQVASLHGSADRVSVEAMLTGRERQVLELLVVGGSNREISRSLGIDEVTVKAHLGRMLRKAQCKNRVELTLRILDERAAARKDGSGTEEAV